MAIPAKITRVCSDHLVVDLLGTEKKVKCPLPDLKKGDCVLVHNKTVVEKLDNKEFKRIVEEYSALEQLNH
jgi:hydrogenase maturation factor